MASYKYEVIDSTGKHRKGTLDAPNEESASTQLKQAGNFVVSLQAAGALEKDIDFHIGKIVKPREMSVFCRQFQSILNAGVPVIDALEMLGEQTTNKRFRKTIFDVRDRVAKGQTLADAMAEHPKVFPEIMIHMIAAGEASGALDTAFDRMGEHFEKDSHIQGLIVKAMIYPIVLIIVIIAVVIIMMVKIIPSFTSTFDEIGAELPAITKIVMSISDFIRQRGWIIAIVVVALVIFYNAFKKTERGALLVGKIGLKMPLFGNLTIKTACSRLTRTMATLIASGLTLVESVKIVEKIMTNAIVKQALKKAQKDVEMGIPLSDPLEQSGIFPPMVYHMIRIGEETGNLEEMMIKVANYYDEEVEMATQSLMSALEPLIIIIMAVVVVPIILAVMMPMFSMYNAIG